MIFTPQESTLEKDAQNPKGRIVFRSPKGKDRFSLLVFGERITVRVMNLLKFWVAEPSNASLVVATSCFAGILKVFISYKDSMPDSTKPPIKNLEKTKVGWDELVGKKCPKTFPFFSGSSQHGDFPKPFLSFSWLLRLRGTGSRFVADRSSKRSAPWSFVGALESWRAVLMQKRQPKRFGRKKTKQKQSSQYME